MKILLCHSYRNKIQKSQKKHILPPASFRLVYVSSHTQTHTKIHWCCIHWQCRGMKIVWFASIQICWIFKISNLSLISFYKTKICVQKYWNVTLLLIFKPIKRLIWNVPLLYSLTEEIQLKHQSLTQWKVSVFTISQKFWMHFINKLY